MNECWNHNRESRPTFQELKEKFDDYISLEERYTYLSLGIVPVDLLEGLGPAEEGLGPAEEGLDPAEEGLCPAEEGLDPAEEGLGPAEEGLDPAEEGLGPAEEGLAV